MIKPVRSVAEMTFGAIPLSSDRKRQERCVLLLRKVWPNATGRLYQATGLKPIDTVRG